jgi:hypothetical protein
MNRKERRAKAAQERYAWSPGYKRTCVAMFEILQAWMAAHPGESPAFALPVPHIFAVASLDLVVRHALARNPAAGELVDAFCAAGVAIGGEPPTLVMLRAVLQTAGLAYEIAPYADFGTFAVIEPGSSAEH